MKKENNKINEKIVKVWKLLWALNPTNTALFWVQRKKIGSILRPIKTQKVTSETIAI